MEIDAILDELVIDFLLVILIWLVILIELVIEYNQTCN